MNIRRFAALLLLLLGAAAALADAPQAVLTARGTMYSVDEGPASELRLIRRSGGQRTTLVVPTTEDDAIESQAKLIWDASTSTLFVFWHRSGDRIDQILYARLHADGTWSDPLLVVTGNSYNRAGLEVVMTRAAIDAKRSATLLHLAWWSMGAQPVAEYALIAYEGREYVSTVVTDLKTLAGIQADAVEIEHMTEAAHPPLAMARSGASSVDVVFGAPDSTAVTRVLVEPKLRSDARLWKPGRKGGNHTPRAGIQSTSGEPVRAMLSQGRIVLYTPETRFRFVIYDKGRWSPEYMIQLDENLTSEEMVQELRQTIDQLDEAPPAVIE